MKTPQVATLTHGQQSNKVTYKHAKKVVAVTRRDRPNGHVLVFGDLTTYSYWQTQLKKIEKEEKLEKKASDLVVPILDLFHEHCNNMNCLFHMLDKLYGDQLWPALEFHSLKQRKFILDVGDTHKANEAVEVIFTGQLRFLLQRWMKEEGKCTTCQAVCNN